jgi:hypothetical protein
MSADVLADLRALGRGEPPAIVRAIEKTCDSLPYTAPELLEGVAEELRDALTTAGASGIFAARAAGLVLSWGQS